MGTRKGHTGSCNCIRKGTYSEFCVCVSKKQASPVCSTLAQLHTGHWPCVCRVKTTHTESINHNLPHRIQMKPQSCRSHQKPSKCGTAPTDDTNKRSQGSLSARLLDKPTVGLPHVAPPGQTTMNLNKHDPPVSLRERTHNSHTQTSPTTSSALKQWYQGMQSAHHTAWSER